MPPCEQTMPFGLSAAFINEKYDSCGDDSMSHWADISIFFLCFFYLEQRLGRSHRITAVRDDHIEFTLSLLHILEAIATRQMNLLGIESARHKRKILFRHVNDPIVDLHLMDFLHQRVFDNCLDCQSD